MMRHLTRFASNFFHNPALAGSARSLLVLAAGLWLCFSPPVLAGDPAPARGLAMHGQPKYGSDATHLDYIDPAAKKGGTLRQSVPGSFDTLNPFTLKGTAALGLDYVYDRLAARVWDEPFTLYGLVAARMIVPDDRSSITFILDPKARFQDGVPITARDVKFSYETLLHHGRPNMRRVYKLVSRVTIEGDRRIRFDFGPGYDRETVMILAMMPVLPAHAWQGRDFDATTLVLPVGSGPYRVKSADPGRRIVYERVRDDWAAGNITRVGQYNFDTLVYDYYRDDTVALEAFKAHEVDVRREFDTGRWLSAYKDAPAGVRLETLPHGRPEWVKGFIFNLRRPPFDSLEVRQALALAFDAPYVNRTLYRNAAHRIVSIFPNTGLAASQAESEPDRRTALRRADALLTQAGWVVRGGRRVNAVTGAPLTFQILLPSAQDEKTALAFTSGLKTLGVAASVRTVDAAQFAGALAAYDYDAVLYYWINSLSPGSEQMIYWGCNAAKMQGSKNYSGVCDPAIDTAAGDVAAALTREDLVAAARKLDNLVMNKTLFVPLFTIGADYWAVWSNIAHPEKSPLYGQVLETWWAR